MVSGRGRGSLQGGWRGGVFDVDNDVIGDVTGSSHRKVTAAQAGYCFRRRVHYEAVSCQVLAVLLS